MSRVLIIEDRPERRKTIMRDNDFSELEKLKDKGWVTLDTKLPISKEELISVLSQYDLIAIHRSWMAQTGIGNVIEDFLANENKFLITFSGGITQNLLMNNRKRLNMNSTDFYKHNLIEVIERFVNDNEECSEPLLELLYGRSWKLPLLMQYRNILWLGGQAFNQEKEFALRELLDVNAVDELKMEFINNLIEKELINYSL